jgi:hypothetical protein
MPDQSPVRDSVHFPIGYRGLVLNEHRSATGAIDNTKVASTFLVDRFDASRLQLRDQREGLHLMSGGDLGAGTKVFRFVSLQGQVSDVTSAKLEDRIGWLRQTFDIEEAQVFAPTTEGVNDLDYYIPTEVTTVGAVNGIVREILRGRPSIYPQTFDRRNSGLTRLFAVEIICPDPRRLLYTSEPNKVANSGNGFSITLPNWNANQGSITWPILTIIQTANGNANTTITFNPTTIGTTTDLRLDLSGLGAATIYVDMLGKAIYVGGTMNVDTGYHTGGTERADIRQSAVDTFWNIPRNGGVMSITNRTALTSVRADYRQARS